MVKHKVCLKEQWSIECMNGKRAAIRSQNLTCDVTGRPRFERTKINKKSGSTDLNSRRPVQKQRLTHLCYVHYWYYAIIMISCVTNPKNSCFRGKILKQGLYFLYRWSQFWHTIFLKTSSFRSRDFFKRIGYACLILLLNQTSRCSESGALDHRPFLNTSCFFVEIDCMSIYWDLMMANWCLMPDLTTDLESSWA